AIGQRTQRRANWGGAPSPRGGPPCPAGCPCTGQGYVVSGGDEGGWVGDGGESGEGGKGPHQCGEDSAQGGHVIVHGYDIQLGQQAQRNASAELGLGIGQLRFVESLQRFTLIGALPYG